MGNLGKIMSEEIRRYYVKKAGLSALLIKYVGCKQVEYKGSWRRGRHKIRVTGDIKKV